MEDVGYGTDITFVRYLRSHPAFSTDCIDLSDATQILNSTVVPRPIAFVSTLSAENKPNLAPFRYGTGHVGFVYRIELLTDQSMYLLSFFQVVRDEKEAP
jgi:hypothetical protein